MGDLLALRVELDLHVIASDAVGCRQSANFTLCCSWRSIECLERWKIGDCAQRSHSPQAPTLAPCPARLGKQGKRPEKRPECVALFIFVIIVIIIVVSATVSADPASHGSMRGIDSGSAFRTGLATAFQPKSAVAKDPTPSAPSKYVAPCATFKYAAVVRTAVSCEGWFWNGTRV